MKRCLAILCLIYCSVLYSANQQKMDSLQNLLKNAKDDTTRLRIYIALGADCVTKDNLKYAEPALQLADKLLASTINKEERNIILNQKATAYEFVQYFYAQKADTARELTFIQKRLSIYEEIRDTVKSIDRIIDLSQVYSKLGNFPKALQYLQGGIVKSKEMHYKKGISIFICEMGSIYLDNGDTAQALESFQKSLAILGEIKDKSYNWLHSMTLMGVLYGRLHKVEKSLDYFHKEMLLENRAEVRSAFYDIAKMYEDNNDLDSALLNYQKCLSMAEEVQNMYFVKELFDDIGGIYVKQGNSSKGLDYRIKAMKIAKELQSEFDIAWSCFRLSSTYRTQNKYKLAKEYGEQALKLKSHFSVGETCLLEQLLSKIDSSMGDENGAFEHYKQFVSLRDKSKSEAVSKLATKEKYQNEYDKQKAIDKAEQEKKDAIALEEKRKQKIVIWSVICGLFLVIAFAGHVFRSLRITRKQNIVIEQQKQLVEEKQQEIVDSISYAKRLQQAILPPLSQIQEHFPNSFVLYLPKDIVAGDFYWMHTTNDTVLIASADCTGHGVPGALVSVVCSNALNRTVKEFGLTETGKILDKVTELVLETFEKSGEEIKDGMDISLLSINRKARQVQWSGANNPLWIVQGNILTEIKADKQPIGKSEDPHLFTTHILPLIAGETFYLITDGYADQFSANDKKLMKKKFKELLLSVQDRPMPEQKAFLEDHLNKWKGNMEQTDDVTVIGIKI
jgi:serine phosphatase RsbU (regulator of sigma subunit)